jgi:hypothetical protein
MPGRLQEKQLALQAPEQQTPWAQNPEAHSVACAQIAPTGLRPHDPFWQMAGATQSALLAQLLPQEAPLQW